MWMCVDVEQAVDKGQLAREMESDRVAASRAMAQNKQLKQQLQELQDGFITLVRLSRYPTPITVPDFRHSTPGPRYI